MPHSVCIASSVPLHFLLYLKFEPIRLLDQYPAVSLDTSVGEFVESRFYDLIRSNNTVLNFNSFEFYLSKYTHPPVKVE